MNKPIIGIDNDDVLFQCVEAIFKYHNHHYQTNFKIEEQTIFDLDVTFGLSPEESMERIFAFYESEFFLEMKPFPDALKALEKIKDKYELMVVTARPKIWEEKTKIAIEKFYPGIFKQVHLTNGYSKNGQKKLKSEVCKELGISILVDDAPHNVFECAEAGIKVILFRRPWNRSLTSEDLFKKGIHPAENWSEVVQIIQKISHPV